MPEVGDTLLLWPDRGHMEIAPASLWPAKTVAPAQDSIAVVRLKLHDLTVIDQGGTWKKITTTQTPEYAVGNTVLISRDDQVIRVLSDQPLRLVEVGTSNEVDVGRFKVKSADIADDFDDFGGMDHVVARAKKLIELPLTRSAQLKKIGARPIKGILFSGPPGTGKTMLARIIARHAKATFYTVSGPEILTKWYGESEAVLRAIFDDAAAQEQAIIFFDEIDSVAPQRSDRAHEVSQKLVAQLLALMDGFEPSKRIVVVAATNRPDAVDSALRRPGRFDWEVEFKLPDATARRLVLENSGRKISKVASLPYDTVVSGTDGWSPVELTAIWSEAALLAADDERDLILPSDFVEGFSRVREQRQQKAPQHV